MIDTLVKAVGRNAEIMPEKLAVCFQNENLSYSKLWDSVKKGAAFLRTQGAVSGDRIMISAVSKPEYVIALLSAQYLGLVTVAVDKAAKLETIEYIFQDTDAVLFLSNNQTVKDLNTVTLKNFMVELEQYTPDEFDSVDPDGDELCELLYTTGTTGKPKGAMLTYEAIYASIENTWHGIGMLSKDVVLIPLPVNHSFGMRVLRSVLYIGATVVLQNGFTFAKEIEENIKTYGCTAFVSVPASIEMLLGQMGTRFPEVFGNLRYIEFSAGSVSPGTKKRLLDLLPNVELHNTWGSTETGGCVFLNFSKNPDKISSVGQPIAGVQLMVQDDDRRQVTEVGENGVVLSGRMALKGKMQMKGYWHLPHQTEETLQNGWLLTNDIVYQDNDGYIYMLGRADDIINVGGEKVSPVEVENNASQYVGIKECACIGVPDTEGHLGYIPVLYYVANGQLFTEKGLTNFLVSRMEQYKLPKKYVEIEELPRNQMGKLDRNSLRKLWNQMGEESLMNPVIHTILNRRSIRDFTDDEVPRPIIEMILKAGCYAPSGHNMQTWKFTVITNQNEIALLKETVKRIAEEKKIHFYGFQNPKLLVMVSNDRRNRDSVQDASCAAENIMLAACSYGLGSVWLNPLMTLCDEKEIRALLDKYGIPTEHIVWAMIALGYPANTGKLLAKKTDVISWVE